MHLLLPHPRSPQLAQSPDLSEVMSSQGLLGLIKHAWNDGKPLPIYNSAAQCVNHTMFWESMRPGGGPASLPSSPLLGAIDRDFGGLQQLESVSRGGGGAEGILGPRCGMWCACGRRRGGAAACNMCAPQPSPSPPHHMPLIPSSWHHQPR